MGKFCKIGSIVLLTLIYYKEMNLSMKRLNTRKIGYILTWLIFTAITFILGMEADTWDDDQYKSL